ncbi:unnamed protein product [Thelazia callipaeda]|uniref:Uncharacterized protein n=1 Tax=Thelazia callipaeda TaxID=103827 RepID=A0A0N5CTV7_THECL|nr:unnamed protein product [Thelazia callipaeda]
MQQQLIHLIRVLFLNTQALNVCIYPIASKHEVYSYGQRESLNRTRFLLVRTIASDGKENFKRVTFPGFGSVDTLKLIIEKAMKKGKVLEVITIPDKLKIETNEQIRNMANHQKVEVVFDSSAATNYSRKFSLDEAEIARSKRLPMLGQKYFTEENPKKPVFWTNYSKDYGTSSLNENISSSVSGDNETHITTSGMLKSNPTYFSFMFQSNNY